MELKYLNSFKSYCVFTDLGIPPRGWVGGWVGVGWWGGVGWGWGWGWMGVGLPPHTCTHARAHTHACMLNMITWLLHGGGHLQFPNMFILVFCVCACIHVHMHVSRDTPHAPRWPPTHLPPPQSHREPQGAQITKSL